MKSWYPTSEEIERLGFMPYVDEEGQPTLYLDKASAISGRSGQVELVNDEGRAVLTEWLGGMSQGLTGLHGWTTCTCYEQLEHACNTAFDEIAEGR